MRALLVVTALLLAGCFGGTGTQADATTIRVSAYGIPHIEADSWHGLGLGAGFMQAEHNLCLLAEEYVTVAGERTRWFGDDGYELSSNGQAYTNRQSDAFFRFLRSPDLPEELRPRTSLGTQDARIQDMMHGFIDGYNRYLEDVPAGRHEACRDEAWVRPIGPDDMEGRILKLQLLASSLFFAPYMLDTSPAPGMGTAAGILPTQEHLRMGSNGYAFGGDATASGAGMLLGNPHFPWSGPERFSQLHLTIPGELDVMGMTLVGAPIVLIGFNADVAWTHTVSTAWRFTLYELTLDPADPYVYDVDGQAHEILPIDVDVPAAGGSSTHRFHVSHLGPIIEFPVDSAPVAGGVGLDWTGAAAYAVRDANLRNDRILDQFLAFASAGSVGDIEASLETHHGIPWVNTIAADRHGDAFYADISVVPHVTDALWDDCNVPVGVALTQAANLPVLDGSRGDCTWLEDGPVPGILPASDMPRATSRTWLINSNDSHWLPNPASPLEGYARMIGPEGTERSLRTRMGYMQIQERLAGEAPCEGEAPCDAYTLARLQDQLLAGRMLAAEEAVPALLSSVCPVPLATASDGAVVDLGEACGVLGDWHRHATVDATGTTLFERFWSRAPRTWQTPFDAADPVGTPSGYVAADPRVRTALADAVQDMQAAGIELDAPARDIRVTQRGSEPIPLPGARSGTGAPSMLNFDWDDGLGEPQHGNSHIQTVTWDDGLVAEMLLTYSQSTDPASPHHADQTRAYAEGRFHRVPFTADEVHTATIETLRL